MLRANRRPPRPVHHVGMLLAGAASAFVVSACTSGSDDASPVTSAPAATEPTTPRDSDGVLRVGVLLPKTGVGSQLGLPMIDAVGVARDRINEQGGVLGRDLELVEADEGANEATAASALDRLLRSGVDAIVGPASSLAALADLDAVVDAGVVACSPTATAIALDDYPDDGLFFRTVPSDSLQMEAVARVVERTGARTVAVGHLDDPYGRGLADALATALDRTLLQVVATVPFQGDDEQLADEARDLMVDAPEVVVVLGDADDGSRFVSAIGQQLDDEPPIIVVNDALRSAASQGVMRGLADDVREAVVGVAPVTHSTTDETLAAPYTAHAFDCLTLIALAATQAGSDDPTRIAQQLPLVSVGGSTCTTYEDCLRQLAERQIEYEGPSGNTDISSRTGDPIQGLFEQFAFTSEGVDEPVGDPFLVGAG